MKMKCNNEACEAFPIVIELLNVKMKVLEGNLKYYDKQDEEIVCSQCGQAFVEVRDKEFKGFGKFHCAFAGKTPAEKREILKKRERQYQKKDKVFKEYKEHRDNGGD